MFLYLKFWVPSWIHHAWSLWYFSLACGHCPKPRWEWMNKSLGLSGKFQWVDICLWAAVDRDFLAQLPHKTIRKNIRISTHLAVLSCPKHHLLFSCLRLRISCLWFIYCMLFLLDFTCEEGCYWIVLNWWRKWNMLPFCWRMTRGSASSISSWLLNPQRPTSLMPLWHHPTCKSHSKEIKRW